MLSQLLPSVRMVRGAFAAGFMWLLVGWLFLHDEIAGAGGAIAEIEQLARALPDAAVVAAVSFGAYLVGSLSEDAFGYGVRFVITQAVRASSVSVAPHYYDWLTPAAKETMIAELEAGLEEKGEERDLRVAILPPLIVLIVYLGITMGNGWFWGLLSVPALGAQAWSRTRYRMFARSSLHRLHVETDSEPAARGERYPRAV